MSGKDEGAAPANSATQSFFNTSKFKTILLIMMVIQNSSTVLVGRHTRSSKDKSELFQVNHFIMICELLKFLLSCALEFHTSKGNLMSSLQMHVFDRPKDALKISVPALLYLLQNTLLYVALSNLSAPLFQVTYQGKLVTTAIVSVLLLQRKYSPQQWVCLVCLSLGVAIVLLGEKDDKDDEKKDEEQDLFVGLVAVSISCLSSALAGVYFEYVIKRSQGTSSTPAPSLWMRNMQLAFFSVCISVVQQMTSAKEQTPEESERGYFFGFTGWVWTLVLLQAGGGLLVAAVIKYADNVLKGLATGVSVAVSTAMSMLLFGTPLTGQFFIGAIMILTSVYGFSNPFTFGKKELVLPK